MSDASYRDPVVVATFVVAGLTFLLAIATFYQGHLARRSLALAIRPLLGDALPDSSKQEAFTFGAPGRNEHTGAQDSFYFSDDVDGLFQCSLALRNVGMGVAVVQSVRVEPEPQGDVMAYKRYIPQGETVRISVSSLQDRTSELVQGYRSTGEFSFFVTYSDVEGRNELVSRIDIGYAATSGTQIRRIAIYDAGATKPFVVSQP